ncbi:hypothetical protein ACTFIW_000193 (mitochondrion) [Dictyostelium discoideum]
MFRTRGKSACFTTFVKHQRLNVIHPESKIWFNEWFVGMTDGDGSFSLLKSNEKISLTFKLSQSTYNIRLLYYIKKQLGIGTIKIEKKTNMAHFRVRNVKHINDILIPIFDKHLLVTKKEWDYIKFKKGLNAKITSNNEQLTKLLLLEKPREYKSNFWEQKKSLTKPWILGFIEAEGSYYITKKEINRYVHGFGITQKEDEHVLDAIKKSLHISTKIKQRSDIFLLDTTNSRAIENIIEYSENALIGMKAIECRIWSRSYRKHKGNYNKLKKIQELIRKMKEKMKTTQDEGIVRTIMKVIESNDNTDIKV